MLLATSILTGCLAEASGSPNDRAQAPTPTPVAEWARFTSDRYGYAVDHPADWTVSEKLGTPIVAAMRPFAFGADMFATDDAHRYLTREGLQVAAVEVDPSATLDAFTRSVHMACGGPRTHDEVTLDGKPAIYRAFRCDRNKPVYVQVTALHDGRGYVLWLMTSQPPHADRRPDYQAIIDSFAFTEPAALGQGG